MKKTVWKQGLFSITLELGRPNIFTFMYRDQKRSFYKVIGVMDKDEISKTIKAFLDVQKRIINRLTYEGEAVVA